MNTVMLLFGNTLYFISALYTSGMLGKICKEQLEYLYGRILIGVVYIIAHAVLFRILHIEINGCCGTEGCDRTSSKAYHVGDICWTAISYYFHSKLLLICL